MSELFTSAQAFQALSLSWHGSYHLGFPDLVHSYYDYRMIYISNNGEISAIYPENHAVIVNFIALVVHIHTTKPSIWLQFAHYYNLLSLENGNLI